MSDDGSAPQGSVSQLPQAPRRLSAPLKLYTSIGGIRGTLTWLVLAALLWAVLVPLGVIEDGQRLLQLKQHPATQTSSAQVVSIKSVLHVSSGPDLFTLMLKPEGIREVQEVKVYADEAHPIVQALQTHKGATTTTIVYLRYRPQIARLAEGGRWFRADKMVIFMLLLLLIQCAIFFSLLLRVGLYEVRLLKHGEERPCELVSRRLDQKERDEYIFAYLDAKGQRQQVTRIQHGEAELEPTGPLLCLPDHPDFTKHWRELPSGARPDAQGVLVMGRLEIAWFTVHIISVIIWVALLVRYAAGLT